MPAPNTPADLVTLADLGADPHPALARLRAAAPVSWVPALGAWLITGYDLAVEVLRDARTFTVDDPRFSTAKVVGPSMLSLDGAQHARHRVRSTASSGAMRSTRGSPRSRGPRPDVWCRSSSRAVRPSCAGP